MKLSVLYSTHFNTRLPKMKILTGHTIKSIVKPVVTSFSNSRRMHPSFQLLTEPSVVYLRWTSTLGPTLARMCNVLISFLIIDLNIFWGGQNETRKLYCFPGQVRVHCLSKWSCERVAMNGVTGTSTRKRKGCSLKAE